MHESSEEPREGEIFLPDDEQKGKQEECSMTIHVLQIPYDSSHRDTRMGHGPIHLTQHGVVECLQRRMRRYT
jgi:hypothetical protein